jgi:hypothetical protein
MLFSAGRYRREKKYTTRRAGLVVWVRSRGEERGERRSKVGKRVFITTSRQHLQVACRTRRGALWDGWPGLAGLRGKTQPLVEEGQPSAGSHK